MSEKKPRASKVEARGGEESRDSRIIKKGEYTKVLDVGFSQNRHNVEN